jgi:hypothetical protein
MRHGQNITSSFVRKKSARTETCKITICRRMKIFQITGTVLVAEGEGWGENTQKKSLHLHLTLLMIGTIPPFTIYALMAWQGTTSPVSFTYTQTEIADTDTQMETNPRKSLHHVAVQSGVSKS